jgi:hypothetical protein
MNDMSPVRPDLADVAAVGNRQALIMPEGLTLAGDGQWVVLRVGEELRLVPYVEDDWRWANGLAGVMDNDWARAVEQGRIGADHPDNALDDEVVLN